jgi:mevalonate kinase
LENNDITLLATMFNAAHTHLRALGISTPTLEELRTKLSDAGALGVKITGGGMGGCLIALFNDEEKALATKEKLKSFPSWMIDLRNM